MIPIYLDTDTFILQPATTQFQKAVGGEFNHKTMKINPIITPQVNVVLAANGAGTHVFAYNGGIEAMEVYDATDTKNLKLLKSHAGTGSNNIWMPLYLPFIRTGLIPTENMNFFGTCCRHLSNGIVDIVDNNGTALYDDPACSQPAK